MIDTETKRKSILNFSDGDLLPVADGSFAQGDRFTLLDLYSGIAAVAQAATITIEGNVFTQMHGGVNVDSNRLLTFQMANENDVVFDFPETQVT